MRIETEENASEFTPARADQSREPAHFAPVEREGNVPHDAWLGQTTNFEENILILASSRGKKAQFNFGFWILDVGLLRKRLFTSVATSWKELLQLPPHHARH